MSETDYEDVVDKIQEGLIYEITNFHALELPKLNRIVPHDAQLMFNNRTVFRHLNEVHPPYPRYWFRFIDYYDLPGLKGDDTILSGTKLARPLYHIDAFLFFITSVLILFGFCIVRCHWVD